MTAVSDWLRRALSVDPFAHWWCWRFETERAAAHNLAEAYRPEGVP